MTGRCRRSRPVTRSTRIRRVAGSARRSRVWRRRFRAIRMVDRVTTRRRFGTCTRSTRRSAAARRPRPTAKAVRTPPSSTGSRRRTIRRIHVFRSPGGGGLLDQPWEYTLVRPPCCPTNRDHLSPSNLLELPRHRPPTMRPPHVRRILPPSRADHHASVELPRHVLR